MASSQSRRRKPRIRKTAPTIRQRAEAAQAEAVQPDGKVRSAVRQARSRSNPLGRVLAKPLRPVAKALGWLVPKYFINSWREMRQVTWPSRRETWRLTGAVFIFALVFGALVALVDKGLDEIFKKVVLK